MVWNSVKNHILILSFLLVDQFEDDGVTPLDFECALPHLGANPGKNDMQLADLQPSSWLY